MKNLQSTILLLFICLGCTTEKSRTHTSFIDNTENLEYFLFQMHLFEQGLNPERRCQNETLRALNDINKDKLTYFYYVGLGSDGRYLDEMSELLKLKNINIDYILISCLGSSRHNEIFEDCYPKLLNAEIERRFGETFIDSIKNVSEHLYIQSRKDKIFSIDGNLPKLGKKNTYRDSNDRDSLQELFLKAYPYPTEYKFKNEAHFSFTSAYFTLFKDGSIDSLQIDSHFANPKNEIYLEYFETSLKTFVENYDWSPVHSFGIPLNVRKDFTIYYD